MFLFDVETLAKQSHSVILSFACVYFNPDDKPSPQELLDSVFFAKLDAQDQMKRLKRVAGKSTMEWWAKQCDLVKNKSFVPNPKIDEKFEDAYERLREWADSKNDPKCWVWARGNLDQLVMDDIEEQIGLKPVFEYSRWRDVRTAIDFLYNTNRGYVGVDYPGYDPRSFIYKHDPCYDIVDDAVQLMYGKNQRLPE